MVNDRISNLIVKIKNASAARKETFTFPYSNYVGDILECLKRGGFISDYSKKGKKLIKSAEVTLAYAEDGSPKVIGTERISKLSKRIYKGSTELRPVRNGFGMLVMSTSKGVLSDIEARKEKVGGEALFKIW